MSCVARAEGGGVDGAVDGALAGRAATFPPRGEERAGSWRDRLCRTNGVSIAIITDKFQSSGPVYVARSSELDFRY